MSSVASPLPRHAACLVCRRKKIRCDAAKPYCGNCTKSSHQCQYDEPPRPRPSAMYDSILHLSNEGQNSKSNSSGPGSSHGRGSSHGGSSSGHSVSSHGGHGITGGYQGEMPSFPPTVTTVPLVPEISNSLRNTLIQIFFDNKEQCLFQTNQDKFMQSLGYSSHDLRAPHPALVQAILLLGAYFSHSPSLADLETQLLSSTRQELSNSFAQTDRLHDFVRGGNLVACYYLMKGMHVEAYQQIRTTAHVAVNCNLHQIPSAVWRPPSHGEHMQAYIHPARNSTELGERIYTFWQTFSFDKLMSMAMNHPPRLNEFDANAPDVIITPFPRLMEDYENGKVSELDTFTASQIYDEQILYSGAGETLEGLQAQSLSLLFQARNFVTPQGPLEPAHQINVAIQRLAARIPEFQNGTMKRLLASDPTNKIRPVFTYIVTMVHAASLIINQHGIDNAARARSVAASQTIAQLFLSCPDEDYARFSVGLGHVLYFVIQAQIQIVRASHGNIRSVKADMFTIMKAMRNLSMRFLSLGLLLKVLENTVSSLP